jgi:multiple sugar transport system permease protein
MELGRSRTETSCTTPIPRDRTDVDVTAQVPARSSLDSSEIIDAPIEISRARRFAGSLGHWGLNLVMIVVCLIMIVPFYWVIVTAFVPQLEAFGKPPDWTPSHWTLDNVRRVFDEIPFWRMFFNSLKISLIVTIGSCVTSTMAAYAFARLQFPGRDLLFIVFLAALMVPGQVTIIPTFILMRHFGLINNQAAVWLPGLINVFGIFLLRQYFLRTPRDLEEAARLDGAGHMRVMFQIALPLASPAIAALAVLTFTASWNQFLEPNLFLNSPDKLTLPVGLVKLSGMFRGSPITLFAGITMVLLPVLIVFILAQRRLTDSIALTGMRG